MKKFTFVILLFVFGFSNAQAQDFGVSDITLSNVKTEYTVDDTFTYFFLVHNFGSATHAAGDTLWFTLTIGTGTPLNVYYVPSSAFNMGDTLYLRFGPVNFISSLADGTHDVCIATNMPGDPVASNNSDCVTQKKVTTSGINDQVVNVSELYFYDDQLIMNVESLQNEQVMLTVVNLSGQLVYEKQVEFGRDIVDMSDLETGLYVVNIISNEGILTSRKIFKK